MHQVSFKIILTAPTNESPPKIEFEGMPNQIAKDISTLIMPSIMAIVKGLEQVWKCGAVTEELRQANEDGSLDETSFKNIIRKHIPDALLAHDIAEQIQNLPDEDVSQPVSAFDQHTSSGITQGTVYHSMDDILKVFDATKKEKNVTQEDQVKKEDMPPKTWPPQEEDLTELGQGIDVDLNEDKEKGEKDDPEHGQEPVG